MTITLHGAVPSKKNKFRRGSGSWLYLDRDVADAITALTVQAKMQWGKPAIEHPEIAVRFFVRSKRSDRDNRLTTVLDCLQAAGVIPNDNIARCNGTVTILPAIVSDREMTVIEIRELTA